MPRPRAVVTAVFFAFALGLGLMAGSVPVLMAQAGLDAAGLGLALTLNSGAYISAMALGGRLARVLPPRRQIVLALLLQAASVALVFTAASPVGLTLAITALGGASGLLDLAMNTEGTAVERDLGRPVLLAMHAAASGAFALGALAGSLLSVGAGPAWCVPPVLLVNLSVAAWVLRQGPRVEPSRPSPVLPDALVPAGSPPLAPGLWRPVALIGLLLGLCIAGEITAQMWSARLLQQQAAQLAALAGAGAALFAGCQAAVRLGGDRLRHALGDERLIIDSLVIGAVGFGGVALAAGGVLHGTAGFVASLAGFALVGLGTACIVPCLFALLARRMPQRAAAALGAASLVAGGIRLPAPLAIGWLAQHLGDAAAFGSIGAALAVGGVLAWRGLRA